MLGTNLLSEFTMMNNINLRTRTKILRSSRVNTWKMNFSSLDLNLKYHNRSHSLSLWMKLHSIEIMIKFATIPLRIRKRYKIINKFLNFLPEINSSQFF